jgi:oligopeptide transport system ATP-binding protein
MIDIGAKMESRPDGRTPSPAADSLLDLQNLSVRYDIAGQAVQAVRGVSITLARGEVVALVGESGSGKSTIGHALMGLLRFENNVRVSGAAHLRCKDGTTRDLLSVSDREMRRIRGSDVSIIFQEPMSSLNPLHTVGHQVAEAILAHKPMRRREARERVAYFFERLGIPNPARTMERYPHELSGGMRQRVMIAMALSCDASLLIADEATTALDATVQAQIIELLRSLQKETGMTVLFITHDLGVVAEMADRAIVLYAGQIVEMAPTGSLFQAPLMPHTQALIDAIPRLGSSQIPGYELHGIPGRAPSALEAMTGCSFHPRCPHARAECRTAAPALAGAGAGRSVRCLRWQELQREGRDERATARG